MLNKKQIGKIQVTLGILLFIVTIISSVLIIKNIYFGSLIASVSSLAGTWGEASKELNATSAGIKGLIMPEVVSSMTIISLVVLTTMFIFGICALILLTLSIILILQGLSNLATK